MTLSFQCRLRSIRLPVCVAKTLVAQQNSMFDRGKSHTALRWSFDRIRIVRRHRRAGAFVRFHCCYYIWDWAEFYGIFWNYLSILYIWIIIYVNWLKFLRKGWHHKRRKPLFSDYTFKHIWSLKIVQFLNLYNNNLLLQF